MELAQIDFSRLNIPAAGGVININDPNLTLGEIVTQLIPYLFAGAGIVLLIYLISGGLSLMLSKGDPKLLQSAKDKISSALIGFVIVFVAYWLVQIIGNLLGITTIQNVFK